MKKRKILIGFIVLLLPMVLVSEAVAVVPVIQPMKVPVIQPMRVPVYQAMPLIGILKAGERVSSRGTVMTFVETVPGSFNKETRSLKAPGCLINVNGNVSTEYSSFLIGSLSCSCDSNISIHPFINDGNDGMTINADYLSQKARVKCYGTTVVDENKTSASGEKKVKLEKLMP